jgi:hypothetical protein
VGQAFDKLWHERLNYSLRTVLHKRYAEIPESYLAERFFRIKQGDTYSALKEIKAGIPQGSVLGPFLHLLYTSDFPKLKNSIVDMFADDTAILAVGSSNEEPTGKLQTAINQIQKWTKKWNFQLNESKSVRINFTNRHFEHISATINIHKVPYANKAKYLGMTTLDAKFDGKTISKRNKRNWA